MPSSMLRTNGPLGSKLAPLGAPRADVLLMALATTYVSVSTVDVKVGGLPLKLPVLAMALLVWLRASRPWKRWSSFRFRIPVLIVAVGVPIVWTLLAVWLHHRNDPAQRHGLSDAVQEASRFVYLLLYFPLADRGWADGPRSRLWRWPALLICAITVALWIGHLAGINYGASGDVGPFQGAIGEDGTGTFRAFIVNDVLFLPLLAFLTAASMRSGPSRWRVAGLVAVLFALYLAHTRGLWLGAGTVVVVLVAATVLQPLSPRRRAVGWALVAAACLVAVLFSADPALSRHIVDLVTGRNEFSTAERLAQAPQLLHGFHRYPLLGAGMGGTLPSGFVRSQGSPWSFELAYLQLLFQLGVVGTLLVATPLIAGLAALVRSVRTVRLPAQPLAFAAGGALTGMVLTDAGNPYLVTSVGTFALAILLAVLDEDLSEPNGDLAPAAVAAPTRRHSPAAVVAVVTVCVGVLAVAEFTRAHTTLPAALNPTASAARYRAPTTTVRAQSFSVAADARSALHAALVTAADPDTAPALWSFATAAGRLSVTRLPIDGRQLTRGPTYPLGRTPAASSVTYGISIWGPHGQNMAFELSSVGDRVAVRVISLGAHPTVQFTGMSRAIPAPAGTHRDLAIVCTGFAATNLYVIDRYPDGEVAEHQLSGTSSFRHVVSAHIGRYATSFSPRRWNLTIGAVYSGGADVLLVGSDHGARAPLEAHVLLAENDYRTFGAQVDLGLSAAARGTQRVLIAVNPANPSVYLVDPARGTVAEARLR
jgi:hypothetical protein